MLSFILPVLIAPAISGIREATAPARKADGIHSGTAACLCMGADVQPVPDASVLCAGRKFPGLLGHTGTMSFPWALYAGSAAVILTAGQSSCGKRLSKKQKLWIFILCVGTAVLVWTSMYIAFTRPGNAYIDGVQGRYYLPFLPLVWLVLNPERVMVRMENKNYHALG